MSHDAWRKIVAGYLILAVGWFAGLLTVILQQRHINRDTARITHNTGIIRAQQDRLTVAARDYCELLLQPNPSLVLLEIENGQPIRLNAECAHIVALLSKVK